MSDRNLNYELPDYESAAKQMSFQQNMPPIVQWNQYSKKCWDNGTKFYSYRQFCKNYTKWYEENKETLHFNAVIGQKMEVDFAGKTFQMVDHLTDEVAEIIVFVAVLLYSKLIYAEGIISTTMKPSQIRGDFMKEKRYLILSDYERWAIALRLLIPSLAIYSSH